MPVNKLAAVISVCQQFTTPASHVHVQMRTVASLTHWVATDRHASAHMVSASLHFAAGEFVCKERVSQVKHLTRHVIGHFRHRVFPECTGTDNQKQETKHYLHPKHKQTPKPVLDNTKNYALVWCAFFLPPARKCCEPYAYNPGARTGLIGKEKASAYWLQEAV